VLAPATLGAVFGVMIARSFWYGLFTPIAEAPAELIAHFRYPENLFQVQAAQYANYHVEDPEAFYQKRDFWQIPDDPSTAWGLDHGRRRVSVGPTTS
jgi:uncharacterized membrane protein (UPF0182 family)